MILLRIALFTGLIIGGAGLIWKTAPARSKLLVLRDDIHFPVVSGFNLNRQEFEFPRDFGGDLNLVIVPFQPSSIAPVSVTILAPMARIS